MTFSNNFLSRKFPFLIPFSLFVSTVLIIQFSNYIENKAVALAVTIDLLIAIPLIYFFLIRKTSVRNTTVIPVIVLGLLIGSVFIPESSSEYLNLFKTYILPVFEITVITYIIIKVRSLIKIYKNSNEVNSDFFSLLKKTCSGFLPGRLAYLFATEFVVIYYGFFKWHSEPLKKNEFTYHKNNGLFSLLYTFLFIIALETFLIHILVDQWSSTMAWIFTGLSIYTLLQIFGFAKSLEFRRIYFDKEKLYLRSGILGEVDIPISEIESIKILSEKIELNTYTKSLSPFYNIEKPNIILKVKNEHILKGLYGIEKKFYNLIFYLDKPEKFNTEINNILKNKN